MKIDGFYYLHINGDLIYKPINGAATVHERIADFLESDFVRYFWPLQTADRFFAWTICIEACALGADGDRIKELRSHWGISDEDVDPFLEGAKILEIRQEGSEWMACFDDFVNIQESQCGFGATKFDALVALCATNKENLTKQQVCDRWKI